MSHRRNWGRAAFLIATSLACVRTARAQEPPAAIPSETQPRVPPHDPSAPEPLLQATPAEANSPPVEANAPAAAPKTRRQLDGHLFLPSQIIQDPFNSGFLQLDMGVGYAWATAPQYGALGDASGSRTYKIAQLQERVRAQIGILPCWSIRATGTLAVMSGLNAIGLLALGAVVSPQADIGTTVSFPLGDRVRLGGTFDFLIGPAYNANPLGTIVQSVREGQIDAGNLIITKTTTAYTPGVSFAWGIARPLGLVAAGQYTHNIPSIEGITQLQDSVSLGAALDLDLNQTGAAIPVGVVGAYRLVSPLGGPQNFASQTAELEVLYTGHGDLVVGPEATFSSFTIVTVPDSVLPGLPITREADANAVFLGVLMRYYW
jgi:hypothetical protein